MIIANEIAEVQTSNIGKTAQATIKASARLFSFFSDMIYSDKYVAIWRELVANGVDAQVAAGRPERQIIVTLPTDFTPYAKVRDFGTGMSEEFLLGKFMAYTDASTKDQSNEMIGGFGIGSKAPLAYTEQFAIHSYQKGVCKIYSVFKDSEGCPSITLLNEHTTDQDDGIEISFPVEGSDIRGFREAAVRTLTYFQPLPLLVNAEQQLFPPEYTVRTSNWGFLKGASDSRVIQGGVAYPIDTGHCTELDDLLTFGIDFYVPIGSCSIALSRERLSYDDRTIRLLKSLADSIRPDLQKHVGEMFAKCKTRWEAESLYGSEINGYGPRQNLIKANAHYKDKKLIARITPTTFVTDKTIVAMITSSKYGKSNYSVWSEAKASPTARGWVSDIYPKDVSVVLIDDSPNKPVLRMRRYLEENDIYSKGVVIIRPKVDVKITPMEWGRILVSLGRPPYKKLSEIEPAVVTRATSIARIEKIRAYKSRDFNTPGVNSSFVDTLPDTGGYYMTMTTFKTDAGQATPSQLQASGLSVDDVYWFNKGDFERIKDNPNWKPAIEAFNKKAADYRSTHRNMQLAEAFRLIEKARYGNDGKRNAVLIDLLTKVYNLNIPKQGPLYKLHKLYSLVSNELGPIDNSMRTELGVKGEKAYKQVALLCEAAKQKYPELWLLVSHRNYAVTSDLVSVYNKLI